PVKSIAIVNDLFDGPQVHDGVSSHLYKRIAAEPAHQITQRVISGKFLPYGMNPGAPITPEYGRNLVPGEQTNFVAVRIFDGQQFIVWACKNDLVRRCLLGAF